MVKFQEQCNKVCCSNPFVKQFLKIMVENKLNLTNMQVFLEALPEE